MTLQSPQTCPRCEFGQLRDAGGGRTVCHVCAAMTDAEAARVREAWQAVWRMIIREAGTRQGRTADDE
jgi:hypothetical protein